MWIEIPRLANWDDTGPGWIAVVIEGVTRKPQIKCNCGKIVRLGLHHVHADGTVTRSFYHSPAERFTEGGRTYSHVPGCGWHVHLKLKDYHGGDFPPVP